MEYLFEFCATDLQRDRLQAIIEHGNPTAAARVAGVNDSTFRKLLRELKARAALKGVAPECGINRPTMEGFTTQRVSKCIKTDEGLEWHIQTADKQRQIEALEATIEALKETIPKAKPVPQQIAPANDLLCQYTITDYHLGMYAWHEESGEDWDLKKAEQLLCDWFDQAIQLAPDAETGLFAQLGDFLHWDGMDAVTPSHGHLLDADTRFQKVIRCCIRVVRFCIQRLLEKHQNVHVIMATGNHDLASAAWLRELLAAMYDQEPRITIDTSPDVYYCYQHGKTALFYHHGHKRKMNNVSEVFAAKFKEAMFGASHCYGHLGHLHHVEMKETALMTLEQHRTLAPKDAYASSGGWMSGRDAKVITYHKKKGEVSRLTISPDMVK